jgi:hypothetical protein
MTIEIEELHRRIDKIERQKKEEVLTILEILANLTFFGELKKAQCGYAKNGQCSFFVLLNEANGKIPIATNCRVKHCKESTIIHCHLELSDVTCALCGIYKHQEKNPNLTMGKNQINNNEDPEEMKCSKKQKPLQL